MNNFREEQRPCESGSGRFTDKPTAARDDAIGDDLRSQALAENRMVFLSNSLATDGGLAAIADVSTIMQEAGLVSDYRIIGGIAVMLHVLRTGVDVPIRATGDADYGVLPRVLLHSDLVSRIEDRGYAKISGCRRERPIDQDRTAVVDLLVPAYTSRARVSKQYGNVNTTEVPGLADAFQADPCVVDAAFVFTTNRRLDVQVVLPDTKSLLLIKAGARAVRNEDRDATDLWRCLEVANADGVTAADYAGKDVATARSILYRELRRGGPGLEVITRDLSPEATGRIATRIQALLQRIIGT